MAVFFRYTILLPVSLQENNFTIYISIPPTYNFRGPFPFTQIVRATINPVPLNNELTLSI